MAICGKCKKEGVGVAHVRECFGVQEAHHRLAEDVDFLESHENPDAFDDWMEGCSPSNDPVVQGPDEWPEEPQKPTASFEVSEGFWVTGVEAPGEADVWKVQMSSNDRLYAKRLNQLTGRFEYIQGGIRRIEGGKDPRPLTLEEAKKFGKLYGICQRCGATLTDETSIENGIGPICAGKFG